MTETASLPVLDEARRPKGGDSPDPGHNSGRHTTSNTGTTEGSVNAGVTHPADNTSFVHEAERLLAGQCKHFDAYLVRGLLAVVTTLTTERDSQAVLLERFTARRERLMGVLQEAFGFDAVGDDADDACEIAEHRLTALRADLTTITTERDAREAAATDWKRHCFALSADLTALREALEQLVMKLRERVDVRSSLSISDDRLAISDVLDRLVKGGRKTNEDNDFARAGRLCPSRGPRATAPTDLRGS